MTIERLGEAQIEMCIPRINRSSEKCLCLDISAAIPQFTWDGKSGINKLVVTTGMGGCVVCLLVDHNDMLYRGEC